MAAGKGKTEGGMKPITERVNDMAEEIDVASPAGIVRILRACDGQLFCGYGGYPGMLDAEVEEVVEAVTDVAAEFLSSSQDSCIVLAGAGTSGRLAFLAALSLNNLLLQYGHPPCFHALIAGGEKALLQAQEGAEDDPETAVEDLEAVEKAGTPASKLLRRFLYVGISCGLSATYVAAQLQYAMARSHFATVLIGFNPISMARKTKVANFGNNFSEIAHELQRKSKILSASAFRHFVITPVVGPEAICGSSRLKGGTATKILLEIIFARAIARVLKLPVLGTVPCNPSPRANAADVSNGANHGTAHSFVNSVQMKERESGVLSYMRAISAYEGTYRAVYNCGENLADLIKMTGNSLQHGGKIYYAGAGFGGLLGILDASEQPPTFGAMSEDFQAFVVGGWPALNSTASIKAGKGDKSKVNLLHQGEETLISSSSSAPASSEDIEDSDAEWEAGEQAIEKSESGRGEGEGEEGCNGGEGGEREGGLFESVTMEIFINKVLPKARHVDTLIIVESSQSNHPLPPSLLSAITEKRKRGGLQVALIDFNYEPHDRIICSYFESLEKPRKSHVSHSEAFNGARKTWSSELLSASVVDLYICIELPAVAAAPLIQGADFFWELAIKYTLNAVSTGAHILAGKVYRSLMVDLRVSNVKLYHRAISIVSSITGVSTERATEVLLEAIYGKGESGERGSEVLLLRPVKEHVLAAAGLRKVVPIALLLATGRYTYQTAVDRLKKGEPIRDLLVKA